MIALVGHSFDDGISVRHDCLGEHVSSVGHDEESVDGVISKLSGANEEEPADFAEQTLIR